MSAKYLPVTWPPIVSVASHTFELKVRYVEVACPVARHVHDARSRSAPECVAKFSSHLVVI
jgi:hypothetical protein